MKSFSLSKYNVSHATMIYSFEHYYSANRTELLKHEPVLDYVKPIIATKKIKNIIILGCASGRDFVPFQDDFDCYGFDLVPEKRINWVCKTDRLTYYQCSIEDMLKNIEFFTFNWSESLIYSQGTLMYLTKEKQEEFIKTLMHLGCRNFVLQEYNEISGRISGNPYLKLPEELDKLFKKQSFRGSSPDQPLAHLMLE